MNRRSLLASVLVALLFAACAGGAPDLGQAEQAATYPVTVVIAGTGTGVVTNRSTTPWDTCSSGTCTLQWGAVNTLSAVAGAGSSFAGYSGAGCGGGTICNANILAATTLTATFNLNMKKLTITTAGPGTVTSNPGGVVCPGAACAVSFPAASTVTLTAAPTTGATFLGWTGAGCGRATTCTVDMSAAQGVTASFGWTVTVTTSGAGTVVSTTAAAISCGTAGSACSASFKASSVVALSATADAGGVFVGWSGACSGTGLCWLTMAANSMVTASFGPERLKLSVNKSGTGNGMITSNPAGISCGAACSTNVTSNTSVTLTATPDADSAFSGWTGCTALGSTCTVSISAATSVSASFTRSRFAVTLITAGSGTGTVSSAPTGLSCGASCTSSLVGGQVVTLTAITPVDSYFAGWTGPCAGVGACNFFLNAPALVGATFTRRTPSLTVIATRGGSISSAPAGILCGAGCSSRFDYGTAVSLSAVPEVGATFVGWSGDCTGTGACALTVDRTRTVSATFHVSLTVNTAGAGSGLVASTAGGIHCPGACTENLPPGTVVYLTATPTAADTFAGWTGACSGDGLCAVAMNGPRSVTATFNPRAAGASCAGAADTIVGDYAITDPSSVAALECIVEITGSLTVLPGSTQLSLPRLARIGGGLTISASTVLTAVDLRALERVGAMLMLESNAGLASADLSGLVSVGDRFEISRNPWLTSVGNLGRLTSVAGAFVMQSNPRITAIDVRQAALGTFYLSGNTALTSFRLGPIPAQMGEAFIAGSPLLTDLGPTGLSGLQAVSGGFAIIDTGLTSLGPSGISALASVGGRFDIDQNPRLANVGSLAQLTSVTGPFVMQDNPLITSVDLRQATLGGFYVSNNAALTSLLLGPIPNQVSDAFIAGSPLLTDLGPTGLGGLRNVTNGFAVIGTSLANLGPGGLSGLVSVGGRIDISANTQLIGVGSLAHLATVGGLFVMQNNPLLSSIDLSGTMLGGYYISGNGALTSFRLDPALTELGVAYIADCPFLTDLGAGALSGLQNVADAFVLINTGLTRVVADGLVSVGNRVQIYGNLQLSGLDLRALTSIGSELAVVANPALTALDLTALGSVTNDFAVQSNGSLCNSSPVSVRAHALVGGTTTINGNDTEC